VAGGNVVIVWYLHSSGTIGGGCGLDNTTHSLSQTPRATIASAVCIARRTFYAIALMLRDCHRRGEDLRNRRPCSHGHTEPQDRQRQRHGAPRQSNLRQRPCSRLVDCCTQHTIFKKWLLTGDLGPNPPTQPPCIAILAAHARSRARNSISSPIERIRLSSQLMVEGV
jgi:hypothetical protein